MAGAAAALLTLAGCGAAAKAALKYPVSQTCVSAELHGCPELTDAVIDYVSGEKAEAEVKLRAAAAANEPEKLRRFATALAPIADNVGGDAGKVMKEVVAILTASGSEKPIAAKAATKAAATVDFSELNGGATASIENRDAAPTPTGKSNFDLMRSGMVNAASDEHATACERGPLALPGSRSRKVRVFVGPLVLTNVYASGGCADELFVVAGALERPRWIIMGAANVSLNVSGQFSVEEGEELQIGTRATAAVPKDDVRCSVTWAGYKPR